MLKLTDIQKDKKYLLCVSGGADSMVMLHLFLKSQPTKNFAVVTVNHNMRQESESDALFVKDFCDKHGVLCHVKSVNVLEFCRQTGLSQETAARQKRYEAIAEVSDNYDFVCLAHHKQDNAETVLLHVVRGGGMRGAAGIRRLNGKFLRPLLDADKEQIDEYARQNGVPFVVDVTNFKDDCNRNLLRNKVFPLLKKINPEVTDAIASFARIAAEDDDYLNSLADVSQVVFDGDGATFCVNLLKQPPPVSKRILYKIFRALGCNKDVHTAHIDAVLRLADSTDGSKSVDLPFGFSAARRYDELFIGKTKKQPKDETVIVFGEGEFKIGSKTVVCKISTADKSNKIARCPLLSTDQTEKNRVLTFDADKIPDWAVLRTRRNGDIFKKFGGGAKKLKDFLIDKKIPQSDRNGLIVLAKDNQVFAVVGVEISDDVKITAATTSIAKIYEKN